MKNACVGVDAFSLLPTTGNRNRNGFGNGNGNGNGNDILRRMDVITDANVERRMASTTIDIDIDMIGSSIIDSKNQHDSNISHKVADDLKVGVMFLNLGGPEKSEDVEGASNPVTSFMSYLYVTLRDVMSCLLCDQPINSKNLLNSNHNRIPLQPFQRP